MEARKHWLQIIGSKTKAIKLKFSSSPRVEVPKLKLQIWGSEIRNSKNWILATGGLEAVGHLLRKQLEQ